MLLVEKVKLQDDTLPLVNPKHVGAEWCQTRAPLLISVPSWGGSSRHWRVLPVWYLLLHLPTSPVTAVNLLHRALLLLNVMVCLIQSLKFVFTLGTVCLTFDTSYTAVKLYFIISMFICNLYMFCCVNMFYIHMYLRGFSLLNGLFCSTDPSLPSSTLCTEEVVTFLNTRMLFWACSTSKPEGYRGIYIYWNSTHHLLSAVIVSFQMGLLWSP